MLNNPAYPQVKVIVMSVLAAMLTAAIDVLKDSNVDWRTIAIGVLSGALTGLAGYYTRESNPSVSAIETVKQRGL